VKFQVESLYEGKHVRNVRHFSNVFVALFNGVAKERGVSKRWGGLPMPLPWVPWEILDEPYFKNLVERGLLMSRSQVLGRPT
jgi:hypothetical protein